MAAALAALEPGSTVEMSGENVFLRKSNGVLADDNEVDACLLYTSRAILLGRCHKEPHKAEALIEPLEVNNCGSITEGRLPCPIE